MSRTRRPAVAGFFYPANETRLRADVEELFEEARRTVRPRASAKAIIAPHAGYIYSGPTAALSFEALRPDAAIIRRIVLLGPAHRVAVRGLALPESEAFATPLGEVPVDTALAERVARLPQVTASPEAHAPEHSLEVELPFLQLLLGDFSVLPLLVGDAEPDEVADLLDEVWGGPETRIVISSDLSHYLTYDQARQMDEQTAREILALRGPLAWDRACGATPINGLLVAARRRALEPSLIDLRNSGDTAGDRLQVVGYGAFAFTEAS